MVKEPGSSRTLFASGSGSARTFVAAALLAGGAFQGCSCDDDETSDTGTGGGGASTTSGGPVTTGPGPSGTGGEGTPASTTAGPGGGDGGAGGDGGQGQGGLGGAGGGGLFEATSIAQAVMPFDAVPDPQGDRVYFTGIDANGLGAVFETAEGEGVTTVAAGAPLVSPMGIAAASDGETLYVLDIGVNTRDEMGGGRLFSVNGSSVSEVPGVAGAFNPAALDVVVEDDTDVIYLAGRFPGGGGGHGVVRSVGGILETVVTDAGLTAPSGISVSATGEIYVLDAVSSNRRRARIVRYDAAGAAPEIIADDLRVGFPAGIALTLDGETLFVSLLGPTGTGELHTIDIASSEIGTIALDTTGFSEPAGLHRALEADVFALVDSRVDASGGRIFRIAQ